MRRSFRWLLSLLVTFFFVPVFVGCEVDVDRDGPVEEAAEELEGEPDAGVDVEVD